MRGKGFRVSPWAYRSVITNESPVRIRNGGAAPDPSTQFSLFRLYMIEHPTFHSAQDDEMRREV